MTEETTELTPLTNLSAEDFAAALEAHKASGLAKLYGVTVSTIHYYKMKHAGIKRAPSIAQLEAQLAAKQARAEKQANRSSTRGAEADAARAAKLAEREIKRQETEVRRQELLDQIAALSKPVTVAA